MTGPVATALALLACIVTVAGCTPTLRQLRADTRTVDPQLAAPAEPAGATDEYRLGPGDVVKITVYGSPDLATEAGISHAGTISFPLIGTVKVGGLSPSQAESVIERALKKGGFIKQPHVNVQIAEYRSQQISVLGEV